MIDLDFFGSIIILIIAILLLYTVIILPYVNSYKILELNRELGSIKKKIIDLSRLLKNQNKDFLNDKTIDSEKNVPVISPQNIIEKSQEIDELEQEGPEINIHKENINHQNQGNQNTNNLNNNLEQQWGTRLIVWIGAISLILAGFFIIKYSIEAGLMSPSVRVLLGVIFGISLIYIANKIHKNQYFANRIRIAQALSGAGIPVLYGAFFMAANVYKVISLFMGFLAMSIVTITAIILSVRHGMPVALLGLLGGAITPAIMKIGNAQAPGLFIYLYVIFAVFIIGTNKQTWHLIAKSLTVFIAFT